MKEKEVVLQNEQGLHMRPAGVLCTVAGKFPCEITLDLQDKKVNAKSIMMIMAAGIKRGTKMRVICNGEQEEEALTAVCSAIEDGLGE